MSNLNLSISLSFDQIIELVRQLSPADKSRLRDQLDIEDATISLQHQQIVQERRLKSKEDISRMLDWEKVSTLL